MLRSVANSVTCVVLAALAPLAVAASSNAALKACTKLSDDAARLACFDREVAALTAREAAPAAAAAGKAAPAPAAAPPARQLSEEQKMGLTPGRIQQLERAPDAPPPPSTMTMAIHGVSVDGNGHQLFTLQNGQIWRQVELDSHFSVKPGDNVTISRGALGSYFMSLGKHRNTRVSRIN